MGINASTLRHLLRRAHALLPLPSTRTPADLPNDVIFDILARIPVISACRFRCVSREWRTLISDPTFIAAHKSHSEPLLVDEGTWGKSFRVLDMDGNVLREYASEKHILEFISTSHDDLVCVRCVGGIVKVFDPATGEVLSALQKDGILGFGRAIPSGVYKLFFIWRICEVLTVGDCVGWRRKEMPPTNNIIEYRNPVVVNGILYLIILAHEDESSIIIHSFDLETEEWKNIIKGPPNVKLHGYKISLRELNGALCMVQKDSNDTYDGGCTSIWILNNSENSSWMKAYNIPLNASTYYRMIPLRILRDGRGLLFSLHVKSGRPVLQIYDPHRGGCTNVTKKLPCDYGLDIVPCGLNLEHFV